MGSPALDADVVVAGGGPAGASAATLLARWGHRVILVDREPPRPPLAESLPPSAVSLLRTVGIDRWLEGGGALRATGNTVWWGGSGQRVEPFAGARIGYQVMRGRFDAALRGLAVEAGVTVLRPATVLGQRREGDRSVTRVSTERGEVELSSTWTLDATGRSGVLVRGQRQPTRGLRTLALAAAWESEKAWPLPDASHTLVESAEWGWGWSVPATATRRYVTVMLDPSAVSIAGADLERHYHGFVRELPALAGVLASATQVAPAFACDASTYTSADPVGDGVVAVGDAVSFLDPLSSFGMKKAMASGWLGAVFAHTCLSAPEAQPVAATYVREREAQWSAAARQPLGELALAAGEHGFWSARATLAADEVVDDVAARLREAPEVQQAFARLRERDGALVDLGDQPAVQARAVVEDNRIVWQDQLLLSGGVVARHLRNVDLLTVRDLVVAPADPGVLYDAYVSRRGNVPLPDFLGALAALLAARVLRIA